MTLCALLSSTILFQDLQEDQIDNFVILGEFTFEKKKVDAILLKKSYFLVPNSIDIYNKCKLNQDVDLLVKQTFNSPLFRNIGKYIKHDKSKDTYAMIEDRDLIRELKKKQSMYKLDYIIPGKRKESSHKFINREELELSDGYISIVSKNTIMKNSEILKWGLNEQLLAIVENYIGLPPLFPGIYLRRDVANSKQTGTRYWHIHGEDSKIIKVIIYLEDVEKNDGPFCYIPRSSITTEKFEVFNGSRVNDEDVTKKIPERFQNECTGPAGTVIFVDTCSVWHRGKTGTNKDRYTAFYIYTWRCLVFCYGRSRFRSRTHPVPVSQGCGGVDRKPAHVSTPKKRISTSKKRIPTQAEYAAPLDTHRSLNAIVKRSRLGRALINRKGLKAPTPVDPTLFGKLRRVLSLIVDSGCAWHCHPIQADLINQKPCVKLCLASMAKPSRVCALGIYRYSLRLMASL